MDLRIKKTKRAYQRVCGAYQGKTNGKNHVKDNAERAEINKTTFYAHYETVYDLVDHWRRNRCRSSPDHTAQICWYIRVPLLRKFMALNENGNMDAIPSPYNAVHGPSPHAILEKYKQRH